MKRCGLCGSRIWLRKRYALGAHYHVSCHRIKTRFLDKMWEAMSYLNGEICKLRRELKGGGEK